MARGRMLSRSFSTSEKRAALHDVLVPGMAEFAQALYMLLISHADDFGREAGDLFTVKHAVDPSSPRPLHEFSAALSALEQVRLIDWYEVAASEENAETRKVIQIKNFEQHQVGLHKRTTSKFPAPPTGASQKFRGVPSELNRTELNRTELKGTELKGTSAAAAQPLSHVAHDPNPRTPDENVEVITALVLKEVLPMGLTDDGDAIEATKRLCAERHIVYNGRTVQKAFDSALWRAEHRS